MQNNGNCNPTTGIKIILVVVDINLESSQTLKSSFKSTHAMFQMNMNVGNCMVKQAVLRTKRCGFFVNWNHSE